MNTPSDEQKKLNIGQIPTPEETKLKLHSVFLHVRKIRRTTDPYLTVKLVRDASKFEKGVELPLAGMNLLNILLGIDLFKALRKENKSQKDHHNLHQE
ncbi:hypothetical protein ACS0TY_020858 [Phlomoides rotata]